jgi:hypothetical protein
MKHPHIDPRKRWFPALTAEQAREFFGRPDVLSIDEAKKHWRNVKQLLTRDARRAFHHTERWTYTEGGLPAVVAEYGDEAWAIAFELQPDGRIVAIDVFAGHHFRVPSQPIW